MAEDKYSNIANDNCGIYMIRNTVNGKIYIGQSHNIRWRWWMHKSSLNANCCHNPHFQSAWNKYGEDCFEFSIVELCSVDELDEREQYWISFYHSQDQSVGYNIQSGGNSSRGWKMSPEAVEKIRKSLKAHKRTPEHCRHLSEARKEYYKTHKQIGCKKVICVTTQEIFDSMIDAHKTYPQAAQSAISSCCHHKLNYCGIGANKEKLVWMFLDEYNSMPEADIAELYEKSISHKRGQNLCKPIKCLTTGQTFPSLRAAASHFGISSQVINGCLKGRNKIGGKMKETNKPLYWAYCG